MPSRSRADARWTARPAAPTPPWLLPLVPATFVLLWSSGALFAELGLRSAKPLTFLSLRLLASTAILWPVVLGLRPGLPTTRTEFGRIVGTGLLLQVGYQSFFFLALSNSISPGLLAIILGVQPILTPWIAREPTTSRERLGLTLGLAGLCLVVANTLVLGAVSAVGVTSAIGSLDASRPGPCSSSRSAPALSPTPPSSTPQAPWS